MAADPADLVEDGRLTARLGTLFVSALFSMGYILTLAYTALLYLSVADLMPTLAPLRPSLILVILALLASVPVVFNRQDYFRMPEMLLMTGFIGAIYLSLIAHGWYGGVLLATEKFLPAGITFFLMAANCSSLGRVRLALYVLLALALGLAIKGALVFHSGDYGSPWILRQTLWTEGMTSQYTLTRIRALGVLNDPNDLAQFLIVCLPVTFLAWKKGAFYRNIPLVWLPIGILLYGAFLTRSRGSLVGLMAITGAYLYRRYGRIASVVGTVVATVGLLALGFSGGRALSYSGGMDRIMLWSDGLGMFKSSPLWGVSWGSYTDHAPLTAHNSYVLCFAELGLIGYFFYIGLIVVAVMRINRFVLDASASPEFLRAATVLRYMLFAFIATSAFLSRTYEAILYLLIGLILALEINKRSAMPPSEVPLEVAPPRWIRHTVITVFTSIAFVYITVRARGL